MEMGENKLVERPLMSEEEFGEYMKNNRIDVVGDFYNRNILHLRTYEGIGRYKSIRRAIKRGHVSIDGFVFPKRPFNNSKHHRNSINNKKKYIYEQLKNRKSA